MAPFLENFNFRWLHLRKFLKGKQGKVEPLCFYPPGLRRSRLFALNDENLKCHRAIPIGSQNSLLLGCLAEEGFVKWLYR